MAPLFSRQSAGPAVRAVPRAEWSPLPMPGARGVDAKVLVQEREVTVAMLRLGPDAAVPEHQADHETEVVCLEGNGFTSVDGLAAEIHAGESVNWPAGRRHALWTESSLMLALMVEHPRPYRG